MEKVNINGYVLDATTEEDHKRAMLYAVLDAIDMDIENEVSTYLAYKEKESNDNGKVVDKVDKLTEVARPLVEYIRKSCTPMTAAMVTGEGVELMDIQMYEDIGDEREM